MSKSIVIVFDCGATNVRAIAINRKGEIVASGSYPNNTRPDPEYPDYRIWDTDEIWDKMCKASRKVLSNIRAEDVAGVTVTTFGVDGTLFDSAGKMLYPVISWQCPRTSQIMAAISKYIPLADLYSMTAVQPFNFNTINKLIWLMENRGALVEKSFRFLFMPSIFSYLLTGTMVNDITMAGTSMLAEARHRQISEKITDRIGFPASKFGPVAEPGTITGTVTAAASQKTSIPKGTPVVATGHDTQFAIFGSGAVKDQPVLSSGTWEILMVRAADYNPGEEQLNLGITTELDVMPGFYNIGTQWLASGIIEWARRNFFNDVSDNVYRIMIDGAEKVPQGCNGVRVIPRFFEELNGNPGGQILGLTMDSTRDEIFRAILEALSERLVTGKKAIENAGRFTADSILCVGGGSRNRLWNQLRANYTGVPLKVTDMNETTVLGASFFVQSACGNFSSPEEARNEIAYNSEVFEPQS